MYLICNSFFFLIFSMFFNYFYFILETSLLQGGPAPYCRAELHCTALKGDVWHPYPLSNPKVPPPGFPLPFFFYCYFLTPLDTPKKGIGISASICIGQESQCFPYAGIFFTKFCSYLLYAYNGALVSTNQIQSHKTFLSIVQACISL